MTRSEDLPLTPSELTLLGSDGVRTEKSSTHYKILTASWVGRISNSF